MRFTTEEVFYLNKVLDDKPLTDQEKVKQIKEKIKYYQAPQSRVVGIFRKKSRGRFVGGWPR